MIDPAPGCRFRWRCPLAIEECHRVTPELAGTRSRPRTGRLPRGARPARAAEGVLDETRGRRRRLDLHPGAGRRHRAADRRHQDHRAGARRSGCRAALGRRPVLRPDHGPVRTPGDGLVDLRPRRRGRRGRAPFCSSCEWAVRPPRHRDETWPLECGCVGQETTGAGGFAKALRTVPVVLDVAARVRERAAADAWIIDFTNPVGIVTRALLDAGHRAIGLCNVAIGYQRDVRAAAGRGAGRRGARSRRPEPPHLGTRCARGRHGPASRTAREPRRGDCRAHRAPARRDPRSRRGAVLLSAVLLGARRGCRGGARAGDQGAGRRRDRAPAAADVCRPRAGHQARAADAPGRSVLLRGRGGPAGLAGHRRSRPSGGERPQSRDAAVPVG